MGKSFLSFATPKTCQMSRNWGELLGRPKSPQRDQLPSHYRKAKPASTVSKKGTDAGSVADSR